MTTPHSTAQVEPGRGTLTNTGRKNPKNTARRVIEKAVSLMAITAPDGTVNMINLIHYDAYTAIPPV
ncbi:hypothetical protein Mnod_6642 [Methylobacterium nodulans ORS 2060]|uniref:Uncharacterized protein n=1 Tax=Methylobacterium nodulans (strain LMG 21967 / CNCM I-2342 / ORS 2060) TaxID=460265 RepID=B8IER5_METNO|nr:hypothetical protein Mnod_6642 [Methylobacterium nodulans ORS 2060]